MWQPARLISCLLVRIFSLEISQALAVKFCSAKFRGNFNQEYGIWPNHQELTSYATWASSMFRRLHTQRNYFTTHRRERSFRLIPTHSRQR
jgi:hypothetical protein